VLCGKSDLIEDIRASFREQGLLQAIRQHDGAAEISGDFMLKRTSLPFTVPMVKVAGKGPTRIELWDSELPGFGLRIEPSGGKTFFVKYPRGRLRPP
jgi:hypothetical protein